MADTYNRAIRKVTASGTVTTLNGAQTRFFYPQGIAMSSSGTIFVADGDNQDVSSGGVLSAPPSGTQVASTTRDGRAERDLHHIRDGLARELPVAGVCGRWLDMGQRLGRVHVQRLHHVVTDRYQPDRHDERRRIPRPAFQRRGLQLQRRGHADGDEWKTGGGGW